MSATGKAAPSKGAAARAEINGGQKTYEWRGLKFKLPSKLPGVLIFHFKRLEDSEGDDKVGPIIDLLDALLGGQVDRVEEKIAKDGVSFDEVSDELLGIVDGISELYGTATGESEASPKS